MQIKLNRHLLRRKLGPAVPNDGRLTMARKKMTRKKSAGNSGSKPASKTAARRVPMREFSRSLPMSLLRAREAVMRHFRASLRNYDLTEQQWRFLRALASVDTIEVPELARVALLLGPTLSRILRDLAPPHLTHRRVPNPALH